MPVPSLNEIGKYFNEVFYKGFPLGLVQFDLRTCGGNLEVNTGANHSTDNKSFFGTFESKYRASEYGLTVTNRWNTTNDSSIDILFQDNFRRGSNFGVEGVFNPSANKLLGKLKGQMRFNNATIDGSLDVDSANSPSLNGSLVTGINNLFFGWQFGLMADDGKFSRANIVLGMRTIDTLISTKIENFGKDISNVVYYRSSPRSEVGLEFGWKTDAKRVKFGVGGRYILSESNVIRCKIDHESKFGFSFLHMHPLGFMLTVATQIDLKNINGVNHKVGLGIEFSP